MAMSTCEVYDENRRLNFFDPPRLLATTMWDASALRTSTKPGHFKHATLTDAFLFLAIPASRILSILSFVHSSSNSSPASFRQTAIIAQAFSSSAGVIVLGVFQLHMKPAACLIMYSKLLRTICFWCPMVNASPLILKKDFDVQAAQIHSFFHARLHSSLVFLL